MAGADDLNRLSVDLGAAASRIGQLAAVVVRKSTYDVQATSQSLAPVDTGALKNSISSDFRGDGRSPRMEGEVGPTVDYAPFVEFGTARKGPAAFMGPALDRHEPDFVTALERLAQELL